MKVIRLTKLNTEAVNLLVKDSRNDLLTVGKAANLCVEKGLPAIRRKFVTRKQPQPTRS